MTQPDTTSAIAKLTFAEELLTVLPAHTAITTSATRWTAAWSTPQGIWTIRRIHLGGQTTIDGPNVAISTTGRYADATPVTALLRTLGAITHDTTTRDAILATRTALRNQFAADLAAGTNTQEPTA